MRRKPTSSLSRSAGTAIPTWSRPDQPSCGASDVGTKSPRQSSSVPAAALTNTCTPDGEVMPGSRASPAPRVRSTAGQSRALARAATVATSGVTTPSACHRLAPRVSLRTTYASPLRHIDTGLLRCSPDRTKPRDSSSAAGSGEPSGLASSTKARSVRVGAGGGAATAEARRVG